MSCAFSREALALHVEGDLPPAAAHTAASHVATCDDCRRFLELLHARQSLLKSLRRETFSPSECTSMRREVMSIINDRRDPCGWPLRIERTITLGLRRRSYALAACALLAITSVSLLAQMRHAAPGTTRSSLVFEGNDTLLRPQGYRDWVLVGRPAGPGAPGLARAASIPRKNVYINPSGYQGYVDTGKFPEGTLMVWESVGSGTDTAGHPHQTSSVLLAAAKDSQRFDGGWGFFDFSGLDGKAAAKAQALPDSNGCRTCHRQDGETDHVFTQFYPVLRSARHRVQLAIPRATTSLTALLPSSPSPLLWPSIVAQT